MHDWRSFAAFTIRSTPNRRQVRLSGDPAALAAAAAEADALAEILEHELTESEGPLRNQLAPLAQRQAELHRILHMRHAQWSNELAAEYNALGNQMHAIQAELVVIDHEIEKIRERRVRPVHAL